jgi:outer membrane protein assembly factor BamB
MERTISGLARWIALALLILWLPCTIAAEAKPEDSEPAKRSDKNANNDKGGQLRQANPANKRPAQRKPMAVPQGPLRLNIQVQGGRAVVVPNPGGSQPGEGVDDVVIFARDRDAEQLLKKAAGFLDEKRYSEAARALGAIIEAPEDFFYQPQADLSLHKSIKVEAERLLGSLPAEGRQAYELQFGSQAEELLNEALADRDWNKLADVSRRFFHTQAGYRATYLLGLYHLDQGRPLAAGLCLERLKRAADSSAKLEPNLSLQLATAWLRAGQSDKARQALQGLPASAGNEPLTIAGKKVRLFDRDSQALGWLEEHVGGPPLDQHSGSPQWTMFRGNPARNGATVGGAPLLDGEGDSWSISNVEDAGIEKLIQNLRQTYQDANFSALPAFHPLAVDGIVLMRTINTLLAVDFATGKRLWNIPVDENWGEVTDLHGAIAQQGNSSQIVALLDQRLWDDATYGCLSSDGRNVFSIEDLNFNLSGAGTQPRMVVLPNGRRLPAPSWPRNFNRLSAHDIHTGKLKWELGGPRGEYELPMAGAFFLGPPLPLLDVAYAIAEVGGEIRVTAIDARTGEIQWGQQLAVVELDVLQDPARRFSGVSPSYADGVLICPTGSGAIVALDLSTRSLLWGYRYQNNTAAQPTMIGRRIGAMMMFSGRPREENDRWMDSAATIAGGRVIVTPIESGEIHCLDLLDGKLLWKKPRGDSLYVAGVYDNRVVVVGRTGVEALRLEDGQPAWPAKLGFASGSAPSGRGFLSADRYYLPLSSAEVISIDLREGKLLERSRSRKSRVPGNLICYQGKVLSQNVESLETFYELDALKAQVAAALEANPDDPQALAQRGALALHNGDAAAAIGDLRRAYEIAPNERTRDLLIDAVFEGLTSDFARYVDLGKKLEQLISTPEEKSRFVRLMAQGLHRQGDHKGALELYLKLADESLGPLSVERLGESRRARRDRWAQAGLAALYSALSPQERTEVDARIMAEMEEALQQDGVEPLQRFIRFFGFHPASHKAKDRLAQRLATAGGWLSAELLWRQVAHSADAPLCRQAAVRLALVMKSAGRPEAAAVYCRRLSGELADVVCLDGKTGRQWTQELIADPAIRRHYLGEEFWPTGRVIKERDERQTPTVRYFPAEFSGPSELFPLEMTIEMSQDRQTIVGRDGNGQERWKASLGDAVMRHNLNPSVLQARAVGNLVVVSLGGQILAIDTLAAGPAGMTRVLWSQEIGDSIPGLTNQVGVHVRQMELPWGQHRNLVSDGFGRPVGVLGQLGDSLCCLQRGREILAVDPLTGDTLWARGEIEPASEVFGDEQYLFIVPPNAAEALVVSALDGSDVGRRPIPPFNQRVLSLGRRLVSWQSVDGKHVFQMTDLWEQKQLWRHEFPGNSKAYQVDQQLLGVVDPKGRFVAIDLADGHFVVDSPIEAESALLDIYLLASRNRLLLFTNRPWPSNQDGVSVQAVPGMLNNPLLTGMAYGFDRQSGKLLWQTKIEKQGLTLDQPRELPVLVFASRIYERQGGQGPVNTEPYTSVMCLDKRTGAIAYQERIKGHIGMFEVAAEPDERIVALKLLRHTVRMKFTEEPPEANDEGDAAGKLKTEGAPTGKDTKAAAPENKPATPERDPQATEANTGDADIQVELPAPGPGDQSGLRPPGGPIRLEPAHWFRSVQYQENLG